MPTAKGQPTHPRLPTVPCSGDGCENQVRQTRPSLSGKHFCRERECQRQKNRELAQSRARRQAGSEMEAAVVERKNVVRLLGDVVTKPRVTCPRCGLLNALEGHGHPGPTGAPCPALGSSGVYADAILAVWPEPREYDSSVFEGAL